MYKHFCRNLNNFLMINASDNTGIRYRIALELQEIFDIEEYRKSKNTGSTEYKEISMFLYTLKGYSDKYPRFKKLLWEMWGYGFDIENYCDDYKTNCIDEKAKLINLLLSTHYM
jgi:hypothetical protein